jgi:hypothetical protein
MKSQRAQNRLIALNKKFLIEDKLGALPLVDKGVSNLSPLGDFVKSLAIGLGIELNKKYEIADLVKIFNSRGISIKSILGIKCPEKINPDSIDIMSDSDFNLRILSKAVCETQEEIDNFLSIVKMLHDEFIVTDVKVLPSYLHTMSPGLKTTYIARLYGVAKNSSETVDLMVLGVS